MLVEGRDLPVWGFPWTSNPWCRITLGSQAERSRRDDDTSHAGRHRAPVWRQEFHFLVRAPVNVIGSPIDYADRLIGSSLTSHSTACGQRRSNGLSCA